MKISMKFPGAARLLVTVMLALLSQPVWSKMTDASGGYSYPEIENPDSRAGGAMWNESFRNNKKQEVRSCTTCHTKNLREKGKHTRTGKTIEPLAPSVNAERLTDAKKIEKWFKRNCKWTLGRVCTMKEKADFLDYIRTQ